MTDEIDTANEHIERELAQRINAARNPKPMPRNTECLNCGERVEVGRFCCKECADDHEHRARQLKRMGVQ